MIAQLQAQRILETVPEAGYYNHYLRLSRRPGVTVAEIAHAQAALSKRRAGNSTETELIDLLQQALHIRRKALMAAQPKPIFSLEARAKLVSIR